MSIVLARLARGWRGLIFFRKGLDFEVSIENLQNLNILNKELNEFLCYLCIRFSVGLDVDFSRLNEMRRF